MKKERTDSLEYIAKKHKQEQEEYLKTGIVKRVALYARQSVDKKDSISIDTQLDACRRLLKENEPYKEYTDKGYSGKDTNRPAFQQMLKDLHAGKISKIIVYKIDRCSRSVLDFYQLVHTLDTLGCGFVSVKEEHIDTTVPTGKLMIGISAVFAEFERETIQLRITDNYYSRIERDGRWPGGPAPYGYRVKPHSKPSMLEYEPTEIEAVKIIYEQSEKAYHYNLEVERYCQEQGITIGQYEKQCFWADRDWGNYPEPERHNPDRCIEPEREAPTHSRMEHER